MGYILACSNTAVTFAAILAIYFSSARITPFMRRLLLGLALMGAPLFWPTRSRMRRQLESVGFRVEAQRGVFRLPAGLILPSVLTEAVRPA